MTLLALWLAGACQDRNQAQPPHDGARARRMFRPPPDHVRPVPPHAIHARGIGPYELGMPLGDILDLLPHGPRVVLTQIDGVVYYNLVRADGDALVMGVTRARGVVFVSVLDERIARTEDGVGVGTPLARLRERMGPALAHPSFAMDPRMVAFARLPGARFVLDDHERVSPRVVAVSIQRSEAELVNRLANPRPTAADAANPAANPTPVLTVTGSQIALVGRDGDKPRTWAEYQREGLLFAAPLDVDDDAVPEIAVVYQSEQARERERERVWNLTILRHEAGRLLPLAEAELYRLSNRSAAWAGASLDEVELLLELFADGRERVHVTGLFVQWSADRPSNAVQLLPVEVTIRSKRSKPDAASGNPGDESQAAAGEGPGKALREQPAEPASKNRRPTAPAPVAPAKPASDPPAERENDPPATAPDR